MQSYGNNCLMNYVLYFERTKKAFYTAIQHFLSFAKNILEEIYLRMLLCHFLVAKKWKKKRVLFFSCPFLLDQKRTKRIKTGRMLPASQDFSGKPRSPLVGITPGRVSRTAPQ